MSAFDWWMSAALLFFVTVAVVCRPSKPSQ